MQTKNGFTLIELMITISIIGILAAIAIPAYQSYVVRAQVTEGLALAGKFQTDVAEYFNETSNWPADSTTLNDGLSSSKYVTSVVVANGVVTITYGGSVHPQLQGMSLALAPGSNSSGVVVWVCGSSTVPASVTMAGSSSVLTTVPTQYLPASCR